MLFKRKGSSFYQYRFQFLGKTFAGSTRLKNEVKARAIEAKIRTDLAMGVHGLQPMKPGPTFKEYAEAFLEFVRNHSDVPDTIAMYGKTIKRLLTYKPLSDRQLNFIDETVIEGYVKHQRGKCAIATLNTDLRVLRRALNVARKKLKVMTAAPEISAVPGEHKRTFVLSYTQEAAYLAACSDVLRDAAILMVDTGLRVGECVAVQWSDFNADRTVLNATDPTRFDPRVLWLSARCREMLAYRRLFFPSEEDAIASNDKAPRHVVNVNIARVSTSTPFVFPGRFPDTHTTKGTLQGMHVTARQNARLEDGSELPAEFVIHSLRHTFGTRFGELEPSVFIVKSAMGHADVKTSQIYIHPQTPAMEQAFERLDSMNRLMRGEEVTHAEPPAVSRKR